MKQQGNLEWRRKSSTTKRERNCNVDDSRSRDQMHYIKVKYWNTGFYSFFLLASTSTLNKKLLQRRWRWELQWKDSSGTSMSSHKYIFILWLIDDRKASRSCRKEDARKRASNLRRERAPDGDITEMMTALEVINIIISKGKKTGFTTSDLK